MLPKPERSGQAHEDFLGRMVHSPPATPASPRPLVSPFPASSPMWKQLQAGVLQLGEGLRKPENVPFSSDACQAPGHAKVCSDGSKPRRIPTPPSSCLCCSLCPGCHPGAWTVSAHLCLPLDCGHLEGSDHLLYLAEFSAGCRDKEADERVSHRQGTRNLGIGGEKEGTKGYQPGWMPPPICTVWQEGVIQPSYNEAQRDRGTFSLKSDPGKQLRREQRMPYTPLKGPGTLTRREQCAQILVPDYYSPRKRTRAPWRNGQIRRLG
ncbi:uncharacterized protein LOC115297765 [Suricata suricatta]|uniref:uncharacterized protein LOC115297765 n=1 Tax=Suricata suricatta TaxID=37032 RepID=UPI0011559A75|nr:uncharacterized protein LOC115297765 [Suricata suricatta]